jgi:hypothetical protein
MGVSSILNMSAKAKFWLIGLIVATIGVILARVISPLYFDQSVLQISIFLAGVVAAMAGLGLILFGLRK